MLPFFPKHWLVDRNAWKERAIIWLAAVATGLVVVAFCRVTDFAGGYFNTLTRHYAWITLLLCPTVGVAIVWVTRRFFPGAEGSGIPEVSAALREHTPEEKVGRWVSLRIAFGKIFLCAVGLAAGFSIGREGPSVQVGASVMYAVRKHLTRHSRQFGKNLMLAGGAAGIAAAFNTPLAGVIFAIEELGKRFEEKTNGVLISAIVLSGLISVSLQGNYVYFGRLSVEAVDYHILWPVFVCAIACGVAGGMFSRILIFVSTPGTGRLSAYRREYPYYWAGACGLLVALFGLATGGATYGSGYLYTQWTLEGMTHMAWYYAPLKFAATVVSFLSGLPGGIFAPSLAVGVGIGAELHDLFQGVSLLSVYALCMAGFLAAVTQAPLTSFIIVMEMIDGHEMVISLMAVAMLASFIARFFSPPLYTALADLRLRQLEQSGPPKAGIGGRSEAVETAPDGAGEDKKPG